MSLVNDVASGTKVESYFQDVVDKLGVEAQQPRELFLMKRFIKFLLAFEQAFSFRCFTG